MAKVVDGKISNVYKTKIGEGEHGPWSLFKFKMDGAYYSAFNEEKCADLHVGDYIQFSYEIEESANSDGKVYINNTIDEVFEYQPVVASAPQPAQNGAGQANTQSHPIKAATAAWHGEAQDAYDRKIAWAGALNRAVDALKSRWQVDASNEQIMTETYELANLMFWQALDGPRLQRPGQQEVPKAQDTPERAEQPSEQPNEPTAIGKDVFNSRGDLFKWASDETKGRIKISEMCTACGVQESGDIDPRNKEHVDAIKELCEVKNLE